MYNYIYIYHQLIWFASNTFVLLDLRPWVSTLTPDKLFSRPSGQRTLLRLEQVGWGSISPVIRVDKNTRVSVQCIYLFRANLTKNIMQPYPVCVTKCAWILFSKLVWNPLWSLKHGSTGTESIWHASSFLGTDSSIASACWLKQAPD